MTDIHNDVMKRGLRTYDTRLTFVWFVAVTGVPFFIYFFRPTSLNCEEHVYICTHMSDFVQTIHTHTTHTPHTQSKLKQLQYKIQPYEIVTV